MAIEPVTGEENPNRVEGRVKGPSKPLQKQPHPAGHIGTVRLREFQQEVCVTCEQVKHVLERPANDD